MAVTSIEQLALVGTAITFSDNSSSGADYRIERCAGLRCSDYVQIGALSSISVQSDSSNYTYVDTLSVEEGTVYRYRVRACATVGGTACSPYSGVQATASITNITAGSDSSIKASVGTTSFINTTGIRTSLPPASGAACAVPATMGMMAVALALAALLLL